MVLDFNLVPIFVQGNKLTSLHSDCDALILLVGYNFVKNYNFSRFSFIVMCSTYFNLDVPYHLQQLESQMKMKEQQVTELDEQAVILRRVDPKQEAVIEARKAAVAER